jgi:hypothetical protein
MQPHGLDAKGVGILHSFWVYVSPSSLALPLPSQTMKGF